MRISFNVKTAGIIFALLCFSAGTVLPVAAEEVSSSPQDISSNSSDRLSSLLSGWLENDLELKRAILTARSKAIDFDSTKIKKGINVVLSSGNVSFSTDADNNSKITMNPSAEVDIPALNDGSVTLSLPYTIDSEDNSKTVNGGSFSVSAGIVSGASKQRKVELLEAERTFTEAQRDVKERALTSEKEFYEALKKLYNYALSIHSVRSSLYDDQLDLRVLETQGYSKTSAKYRQAFLKVQSDRRQVMEQQLLFERETAIFAMKCGLEYSRNSSNPEDSYKEALVFLPSKIPEVKEERIFDYDQEDYVKSESARWNKYIGDLKRQADVDVSLTAAGEYKFNSSFSGQDDAGGKLTLGWKGLTASAGAYVPTGNRIFDSDSSNGKKNDNPYFQFSLGINPQQYRLSKLQVKQDTIDSSLEEIALHNAQDDYEKTVLSKISSIHDIKWAKRSYKEELDMYQKLEADMEKWLEQGIVTENDWLDAKNNREKAELNIMMNAIDLLIYNNEIKIMFREGENK